MAQPVDTSLKHIRLQLSSLWWSTQQWRTPHAMRCHSMLEDHDGSSSDASIKHMNYLPHPATYQVSVHSRGRRCLRWHQPQGWRWWQTRDTCWDKAEPRWGRFSCLAPFLALTSSGFAQTDLFSSTKCSKSKIHAAVCKALADCIPGAKTLSSPTQEVHFETKSAREECLYSVCKMEIITSW